MLSAGIYHGIRDVERLADDDIYAVNGNGWVLHFNGTRWEVQHEAGAPLNALWAAASGTLFAVGDRGTILRRVSSGWQRLTSGVESNLLDVWGLDANHVYAVGRGQTILRFDGNRWRREPVEVGQARRGSDSAWTGGRGTINAVWGLDANHIWAGGSDGVALRRVVGGAGERWLAIPNLSSRGSHLAIWGTAPDNLYLLGHESIATYNGHRWSAVRVRGARFFAAYEREGRVHAISRDGRVYRRADGATWEIFDATGVSLEGVHGSSATNVVAVGRAGAILVHDGDRWGTFPTSRNDAFRAVFAVGFDQWIMCNAGGALLRFNGRDWHFLTRPRQGYRGLGGSRAEEIYAVADLQPMLHINGTDGTTRTVEGADATWLNAVWSNGPDNVHAVGRRGRAVHYDGRSWQKQQTGVTADLRAIWGVGPADLWAVGNAGTVVHFDGIGWRQHDVPTSRSLSGVWGNGPDAIFAVGSKGTILHFDGTDWTLEAAGVAADLTGIWGSGPNDVHAVGAGGALLHRDERGWRAVDGAPRTSLSTAWWDDSTLLAISNGGGLYARGDEAGWVRRGNDGPGILKALASDGDRVVAVGRAGRVLSFDGESWSTPVLATNAELRAVALSGDTAIAAGGRGEAIVGVGDVWRADDTGLEARLWGAWTDGEQHLVVGSRGSVARHVGGSWRAEKSGTQETLRAVWADGRESAFAVGDGGTALRHDGTSWQAVKTGVESPLLAVHGQRVDDTEHVYAVGEFGVALRWTGDGWTALPRITADTLSAAEVTRDGQLVASTADSLLRFDGSTWWRRPVAGHKASSLALAGTGDALNVSAGDVWRCTGCLEPAGKAGGKAWVKAPPLDIAIDTADAVVPGRDILQALHSGPWRPRHHKVRDEAATARECLAVPVASARPPACRVLPYGVVGVHAKGGTLAIAQGDWGLVQRIRDGAIRSKAVHESPEEIWRWVAALPDQGYGAPRMLFRAVSVARAVVLPAPLEGWLVHVRSRGREIQARLVTPDNRTSHLLGRRRAINRNHSASLLEVTLSPDGSRLVVRIEEFEGGHDGGCSCGQDPALHLIVGRLPAAARSAASP